MTDQQVLDYVMKERQKGTTQSRIVTNLMQRGVTASQIRKIRKMYNNMQKGDDSNGLTIGRGDTKDRTRVNNGISRLETGRNLPTQSEKNYNEYLYFGILIP